MPAGWIGERAEDIALNASRRGRRYGRTQPIRVRLLTWQLTAFLGSTLAAAACLLGDCPFGEKARPRTTLVDQPGAVRSVAFAPDGTLLATVGSDGSVVLRDPLSRRGYRLRPPDSDPVRCLAFQPGGKLLATSSRSGVVELNDLDTVGSQALDDEAGATAGAASLAFAPDGSVLAVGQQDGRITLWDVATRRLRSVLGRHADFVASLAFAPDGTTLASAGGDRSVRVWDLSARGERLEIRGQASTFVALSFSPDSRLLALGDQVSPIIRLWDVAARVEHAALRGPAGAVVALAISPDGKTLAAAGLKGLVTAWDLATLEPRPTRMKHAGASSLAFAPDGKTLASGGFDGIVHLWEWPIADHD